MDSLSPESKAKYIFIADLLEEYGINVKEPYVKPVTRKRKLFEIRIKDKSNIHRILYFAHTGRKFVCYTVLQRRPKRHPKGNCQSQRKEWKITFQERVDMMTYKTHREELLKDKSVREEYQKMLPEYELARSIIKQRLRKKMTQKEVADKTGMPQSTIARIEGLTHGLPKLSTLKKIADALDAKLVVKLQSKK